MCEFAYQVCLQIPHPLPTQELEIASKRAKQMWGKDAPTAEEEAKRSRRGSLGSGYAHTVIASAQAAETTGEGASHGILCDCCRKVCVVALMPYSTY